MNLKLIEDSARIVSAFVPSSAKQEIQKLIIRAIDESKLKTDEMAINLDTLASDVNDIKSLLVALQTSLFVNATVTSDVPELVLEAINDVQDEVNAKVNDVQDELIDEVNNVQDEVIAMVNNVQDEVIVKVADNV